MARSLKMVALMVTLHACSRSPTSSPNDASLADSSAPLPVVWPLIEANRDAAAVPKTGPKSSVENRRAEVRAVARIGAPDSLEWLLQALRDPDAETVALAAHGLAFHCRAKPKEVTGALVMRLATLKSDPSSVLRALGQCDADEAESTLAQELSRHCEPAAFALGDIASRKSKLTEGAHAALTASPCATSAALYPYTRLASGASSSAVQSIARSALKTPGDARIWAIRALGKAGDALALAPIVTSHDYNSNERVEAAKHLAEHAPARRDEAIVALAPTVTPNTFHILTTLLSGKTHRPSKAATRALFDITTQAKREAAGAVTTTHRWNRLACESARTLAQGDHDAPVLRQCAPPESLAWARSRLLSLLSKPVRAKHLADFVALAKSPHLSVREDAIEALASHRELISVAHSVLADAIGSPHVGIVATAATVIHRQPSLVLGADGKVVTEVESAFNIALGRNFSDDATETATALADAVKDLNISLKPDFVKKWACHPALIVRSHFQAKGPVDCPKLAYVWAQPSHTRFRIRSTAGDLLLQFDDKRAPLATSRFLQLAVRGFFNGTKVHRLVPGFVAQFGDPQSRDNDGDGYGGSGSSLPCETSPLPFEPLNIGVAIAGKDTGSSQFFVTLGRTPHLDGAYSWIGQASGPWQEVVEGDVIESVTPEQ